MKLFIYISLLCLIVPSYAQENSAELAELASQYVQGKISSAQVEKQIKNQLPTAIPVFIKTVDESAETLPRKKELLMDLSKAIQNRSTARERFMVPISVASFTLLQATMALLGYNEMSEDVFYVQHPDLMYMRMELFAVAFAPAFSAISIFAGATTLRGRTARDKAISELNKCSLFLTNETFLNETL